MKSHNPYPLNLQMAPKRATRASASQAGPGASQGRQPSPRQIAHEQEVNQQEERGESFVGDQLPPPAPVIDLVQVMHNQTMLLEALVNAANRPGPMDQT